MARGSNSIETVDVKVSTNPKIKQYLQTLVDTGLHGKTPAEVAERLIAYRISEMIEEGRLKEIK